MTADATGPDRHRADRTVAMATIDNGQGDQHPGRGGLFNAPHVDARRSAQNTERPARQDPADHRQGGDITPAEENGFGGAYTVPAGNLFPAGHGAGPGPRSTRWASATRSGSTLDENDVAYITDYSPDSQTPQQLPRAGGHRPRSRSCASRPTTAGRSATSRTCRTTSGTSTRPRRCRARPRRERTSATTRPAGPQNTLALERQRRPDGRAGPRVRAADHRSGDLVLVPRQPRRRRRWGRRASTYYNGSRPAAEPCPRLFPELVTGGVGPHGAAKYDYDPANPSPTKFPPYYDGVDHPRRVHPGHPARDPARLDRAASSRSTTS